MWAKPWSYLFYTWSYEKPIIGDRGPKFVPLFTPHRTDVLFYADIKIKISTPVTDVRIQWEMQQIINWSKALIFTGRCRCNLNFEFRYSTINRAKINKFSLVLRFPWWWAARMTSSRRPTTASRRTLCPSSAFPASRALASKISSKLHTHFPDKDTPFKYPFTQGWRQPIGQRWCMYYYFQKNESISF